MAKNDFAARLDGMKYIYTLAGLNLGIRLCMCVLKISFGFGSKRLKQFYECVNEYYAEAQKDGQTWDATMQTLLDRMMGTGWDNNKP